MKEFTLTEIQEIVNNAPKRRLTSTHTFHHKYHTYVWHFYDDGFNFIESIDLFPKLQKHVKWTKLGDILEQFKNLAKEKNIRISLTSPKNDSQLAP